MKKKLPIYIFLVFVLCNLTNISKAEIIEGTYWSNKKDGPTSIKEAKSKFGNRKLDSIEGIWFDNHKWSVGNVVIYKKDNSYRMNIVEGDTDFNGTWEGTLFKKENLNYDYIGRIWYPQSDGSYTFDTQESDIEVSKSGDYFYSNFHFLIFFQQELALQYLHDQYLVAIMFHNYSSCSIELRNLELNYSKHDPYVNFQLHLVEGLLLKIFLIFFLA